LECLLSAAVKCTLLGLAALELAEPNGRETPEYKALAALDLKCWMCGERDCSCCPTCVDLGSECDHCNEARSGDAYFYDMPDENESQADYEARSYGVPRSGPI
jgi:hypothetical protein